MSRAFVFPGQGAQTIGMGRDLADEWPAAADVFAEVDDALGEPLSALIWEGNQETLTLTENAQPALMAMSMATMAALASEGVTVEAASFVAGHSLGEYSALCAAGAIGVADAARLLRLRGRAMQRAVAVGEGAMAALLGLGIDEVREIVEQASEAEICAAANDNDPGQVVVSGHRAAVERAIELAKQQGAKRAVMLPVSAPFHCVLMQPAAEAMAEALEETALAQPAVPVVANVLAEGVREPDEIRKLLIEQVTAPVRWRESVAWMAGRGVSEIWEIGAGKALSGMVRRIDRSLETRAVGSAEQVRGAAAALA